MISVIGIEKTIKTLVGFSCIGAHGAPALNATQLRIEFLKSANRLQPDVPRALLTTPCAYVGDERCRTLVRLLNTDARPQGEKAQVITYVTNSESLSEPALTRMIMLLASQPNYAFAFAMAVDGLLCSLSDTLVSGTASDAIGSIWCSPRQSWTDQDYFEVAVHELTHTLMFADEFVHVHYYDVEDFLSPETWTTSAIRNTERAPDKVLHSIIVGTEILATRAKRGFNEDRPTVHPYTPELLEQTLESINHMEASPRLKDILAPRANELLILARQRLDAIRSQVTASEHMASSKSLAGADCANF